MGLTSSSNARTLIAMWKVMCKVNVMQGREHVQITLAVSALGISALLALTVRCATNAAGHA